MTFDSANGRTSVRQVGRPMPSWRTDSAMRPVTARTKIAAAMMIRRSVLSMPTGHHDRGDEQPRPGVDDHHRDEERHGSARKEGRSAFLLFFHFGRRVTS